MALPDFVVRNLKKSCERKMSFSRLSRLQPVLIPYIRLHLGTS